MTDGAADSHAAAPASTPTAPVFAPTADDLLHMRQAQHTLRDSKAVLAAAAVAQTKADHRRLEALRQQRTADHHNKQRQAQ